jgi:hypothetical protein
MTLRPYVPQILKLHVEGNSASRIARLLHEGGVNKTNEKYLVARFTGEYIPTSMTGIEREVRLVIKDHAPAAPDYEVKYAVDGAVSLADMSDLINWVMARPDEKKNLEFLAGCIRHYPLTPASHRARQFYRNVSENKAAAGQSSSPLGL